MLKKGLISWVSETLTTYFYLYSTISEYLQQLWSLKANDSLTEECIWFSAWDASHIEFQKYNQTSENTFFLEHTGPLYSLYLQREFMWPTLMTEMREAENQPSPEILQPAAVHKTTTVLFFSLQTLSTIHHNDNNRSVGERGQYMH